MIELSNNVNLYIMIPFVSIQSHLYYLISLSKTSNVLLNSDLIGPLRMDPVSDSAKPTIRNSIKIIIKFTIHNHIKNLRNFIEPCVK